MPVPREKVTNLNMRMNCQKKRDLEDLYESFGMMLPEDVNIFEHSFLVGGLPFSANLSRFNKETEDAIQEASDIVSGKLKVESYNSAEELFDELDAE